MAENSSANEQVALVVHSGDMDKIYSALIIGTGSLAMGMEVTMYFTFWGLQRLRKGALDKGPLSKMHLFGFGKWMVKQRMKRANVASLEQLMSDYRDLGGRVIACEMTMEIMGIRREDLREDWIDEFGAVGTYVHNARKAANTLFI